MEEGHRHHSPRLSPATALPPTPPPQMNHRIQRHERQTAWISEWDHDVLNREFLPAYHLLGRRIKQLITQEEVFEPWAASTFDLNDNPAADLLVQSGHWTKQPEKNSEGELECLFRSNKNTISNDTIEGLAKDYWTRRRAKTNDISPRRHQPPPPLPPTADRDCVVWRKGGGRGGGKGTTSAPTPSATNR